MSDTSSNESAGSQAASVEKQAGSRALSPLAEGEGEGETAALSSALSHPPRCAGASRSRRTLFALLKFLLGVVLCQSVIGALTVIGWTYRLMQRSVLRQWWKLSEAPAKTDSFAGFVTGDTRMEGHVHWPNWMLAQNFRQTVRSAWMKGGGNDSSIRPVERTGQVLKALFASLWTNVRMGVQGAFNTWVLTLPACVLMLFG